jgi:hypothetical protein
VCDARALWALSISIVVVAVGEVVTVLSWVCSLSVAVVLNGLLAVYILQRM